MSVLCNTHHLRELAYAAEQYAQEWPTQLIDCLLDIKSPVEVPVNKGLPILTEEQRTEFNQQYDKILAQGKAEIAIVSRS
ncbi:MAG: transposase [Psychroserpens sp.]